ncbi:MAG: hypothetical protein LBL95_07220, partial [Deltaproteobacteria bacterium]|nr:hypothetical protein [Deltaproteobacteria bacterium]
MTTVNFGGLSLAAANSSDKLGELQASLTAPQSISSTDTRYIIIIAVAVALTLLAAGLINWRRRRR